MRQAIVVEPDDIKQILAERFHVPVKNIVKSQYSYTVIQGDETKPEVADVDTEVFNL